MTDRIGARPAEVPWGCNAGQGKKDKRGAIAELGERLPCTQEVGGSIPPGSTKLSDAALRIGSPIVNRLRPSAPCLTQFGLVKPVG